MAAPQWHGDASRKILKRIVVEGDLLLQTPTHFGNGDSTDLTDMPLLTDALDGKTPLLTGATLAGALRSYLRERERGYGAEEADGLASVLLFGGMKEKEEGAQSPLIIDDAFGENFGVELREGVRIDRASRTAAEGKLYDAQVWQAGTIFPLRFELLICDGNEDALKRALATALEGLQNGEITFGMRKRRGLGAVEVNEWRVREYDLSNVQDLFAWMELGGEELSGKANADIWGALGMNAKNPVKDKREYFEIDATFWLDGSLLIRSQGGKDDRGPDMAYLRAKQADGDEMPVLSGTSLAGALRARAEKIVRTLAPEKGNAAADWVDGLFGTDMDKVDVERKKGNDVKPKASRLRVSEQVIENAVTDLVQNRVSIDRFTGGALETALFNEQPAFGDDKTTLQIKLVAQKPRKGEIGLLLLLLKDLWTGDLALGGESSVGRGRLRGKHATLMQKPNDGKTGEWEITEEIVAGKSVMHLPDDIKTLNGWVKDLETALNELQVHSPDLTNEFVTTEVQA